MSLLVVLLAGCEEDVAAVQGTGHAFTLYGVFTSQTGARAADPVREQVPVVELHPSVEAPFRDIGAAFLHDREGDDLRIGHRHAVSAVTLSDLIGGDLLIEVIDEAVAYEEHVFGRDGRRGHNGREVLL